MFIACSRNPLAPRARAHSCPYLFLQLPDFILLTAFLCPPFLPQKDTLRAKLNTITGFQVVAEDGEWVDSRSKSETPANGDVYQALYIFANSFGKFSRIQYTEVFSGIEAGTGGPCWPYEQGVKSASGKGGL